MKKKKEALPLSVYKVTHDCGEEYIAAESFEKALALFRSHYADNEAIIISVAHMIDLDYVQP